jgi:Protein of unknown function (DUF1236)
MAFDSFRLQLSQLIRVLIETQEGSYRERPYSQKVVFASTSERDGLKIVFIVYQEESSMPKFLSLGVAAALATLLGSAASVAQLGPARATALAQVEPPVSSSRTVKLTEQDRHTIREIIFRDTKFEKAPDNIKVAIGEAVPQSVHQQPIPADVTRKVPQIKNNTFFVKGDQIVIVEPKDNTVADIVK